MSILHIESFGNHGDAGLPAKTDACAGAGTVFLAVHSDAEEVACRSEMSNLVFFREPGLSSTAALVASSRYNIEMSWTYKRIRIPSLRR